MKAGLFATPCEILRKQVIEGDYRDKEVWTSVYRTKCNFVWTAGARNIENQEIFYSNTATVTLRLYVPVEDEDHILIDGVEYRVISINKMKDTGHMHIVCNVEKINK